MNRYIFLLLSIICMTMTSCLKSGLDDLPAFTDANITGAYFEYRYTVTGPSGLSELKTQTLSQTGAIDTTQLTVDMEVTVPAASGTFTETERDKVAVTNLCVRFNISNAASIEPVEGAPVLGISGNFSSPVKYKVIAADGKTSKIWTLTVILKK
ncbi:MAG: hypothetical protein LBT25_13930 [Candidatus Symbiothrix sp.]|nr:hypothetical protein [Candidatus Symbiothrix sp.]